MNRGRPIGAVQTPQRILRKSLQDSAKLATRTRKLLERQLAILEYHMDNSPVPGQVDDVVIEQTLKIMAALDRTIEQTGKLLTQKHTPTESGETASAADVLNELTKGKKR